MVPGAGNPQAYAYGLNNPSRYRDPSGHDPIDAAWEAEFRNAHKRDPNDQDRRDRLFSVIFRGSGVNGAWTDQDWADYTAQRDDYWAGRASWRGERRTGVDSFAAHVDTLSTYYKSGEEGEFVGGIGLVWGGIPYTNRFNGAWSVRGGPVMGPLFEGNTNWRPGLVDEGDANQSHHWAGLFYMGYFFEAWAGQAVNVAREVNQLPVNTPDITLGSIAVNQGRMLGAGIVNMAEVGDMIRQTIDARPAIWPSNSPGSRRLSVWDYIP